jgi:DNA-directed RNA polymerase subunit RPC12/RpoP
MPIQFRCAYCDQLLGIARRKAGSIISCPTCNGRVIVPRLPEAEHVETGGPQKESADLLEREDFDALFQPPEPGKSPARAASGVLPAAPPLVFAEPGARALTTNAAAAPREEKTSASQAALPKPGVHLSPATTVWILVLGICVLVMAFLAGCLVGHFVWVRPPPAKPKPDEELSWQWNGSWFVVPASAGSPA